MSCRTGQRTLSQTCAHPLGAATAGSISPYKIWCSQVMRVRQDRGWSGMQCTASAADRIDEDGALLLARSGGSSRHAGSSHVAPLASACFTTTVRNFSG
jgi:hypothetical protein